MEKYHNCGRNGHINRVFRSQAAIQKTVWSKTGAKITLTQKTMFFLIQLTYFELFVSSPVNTDQCLVTIQVNDVPLTLVFDTGSAATLLMNLRHSLTVSQTWTIQI